MNFNNHSDLEGKHAFLGASNYHWLFYENEKLIQTYKNSKAAIRGTELHEFAKRCIELRQKLPKTRNTLNMYVNDAIGFRMKPEQILKYSDNCFGTADTICFNDNVLRIHDYKSGHTPAHMEQLEVYASIFCLEYRIKPSKINIELRIYQNDEILINNPDSEVIVPIMDKIVTFDRILTKLNEEENVYVL